LYPKQFLPLTSEHTMLQETLMRLDGLNVAPPSVICNEEHRFLVAEQLRTLGLGDATIVLEPEGRNTAPAVALAALQCLERMRHLERNSADDNTDLDDDPLMLVLPADHHIADAAAFQAAIKQALPAARGGRLVTFGITPHRPESGYGYIEHGDALAGGEGDAGDVFYIKGFTEKPATEVAQRFIEQGTHLWNAGIFMFRAGVFLAELRHLAPEIFSWCDQAMAGAERDLDFIRPNAALFGANPSISIDHAIMEHTARGAVVPLDAGWSDIGSWDALGELSPADEAGNVISGDVIEIDTRNCMLRSEGRLIAAVGLEDVIVVETADAVLVSQRDQVQKVREVVAELEQQGRSESKQHRRVYRPWGYYDCMELGERYQVKRITLKPGTSISLQQHHHRAEHWVVVSGTAKVTCGDKVSMITENQSTYIPVGEIHRLENPGLIALELIEVQSGSYLGEDDIVRLQDDYNR
ncbi:MAG: mannose-1-phosphate guanylyltransferase/mannose-6-phosphate isomerase, partial [Geobacteraceae bacterium]|nr:mannose-1-phosphate guanylyltransferase/mannose-6-phosphate isomerase [Geobacteraceae bacterium]